MMNRNSKHFGIKRFLKKQLMTNQHAQPITINSADSNGDLAGAKAYYEQALAIFEERLGPEHPYSKIVRNNLRGLDEAAA